MISPVDAQSIAIILLPLTDQRGAEAASKRIETVYRKIFLVVG